MLQRNTNCTPGINLLSKIRWICLFWSLIWNLWDENAFLSCGVRKDFEIVFSSLITGCHKVLHYHQCWQIRLGKFMSQEVWNELSLSGFLPQFKAESLGRHVLEARDAFSPVCSRALLQVSIWNCGAVLEEIKHVKHAARWAPSWKSSASWGPAVSHKKPFSYLISSRLHLFFQVGNMCLSPWFCGEDHAWKFISGSFESTMTTP